VEDSPSGVLAGVSAGATVYAYSPSHREQGQRGRLLAAGAKDVFGDMRVLQRLLTGTRMVDSGAGKTNPVVPCGQLAQREVMCGCSARSQQAIATAPPSGEPSARAPR
jgi:hypothetical protein